MNNLDDILIKLEYILESDPRTFSNRYCENDWYYDNIYEAYKILKNLDLKISQKEKDNG